MLSLTALPALLIGSLAYRSARQTVEERVRLQLTAIADLKKEEIETWLEARVADTHLLADNFLNQEHFTEVLEPSTDPERRDAFAAFLTDNLVGLQKSRVGYHEIFFVDISGTVILSTDPAHVGTNLESYSAVASTLSSPLGEFIEDVHLASDTGMVEMAFGRVLHTVDLNTQTVLPEVNGAVIMRVRMDETIYPLIHAWPGMGKTGETLLVRNEGADTLFLNPLRFNENPVLDFRIPKIAQDARPAHLSAEGKEGILQTTDYRGVEVLAVYRYLPQVGWGFVAKEDVSEAFAPITVLTRQWLFATGGVLFMAVAVAILLSHELMRPLTRLLAQSQAIAKGVFEDIQTSSRQDELGEVLKAFQAMETAVRDREVELNSRALENAQLYHDLSNSYDHTLDALVAALDARDKETEGHSRRVVAFTLAVAEQLKIPDGELTAIWRGALLHDIGKIGVPDAILRKPGSLTEEEWRIMRCHPEWGLQILAGIPHLEEACQIVYTHQERWDGTGYPRGLAGEAIPLGARIFAIADTFDAITSDRPYRPGRSYSFARTEIEAGSGTQFDPNVVRAFLQIPEIEWIRMREGVSTPSRISTSLDTLPAISSTHSPLKDLEDLNHLVKTVSGTLDLDEILCEAAQVAGKILNAAACGLFLYDPHQDYLLMAADYGLPETFKAQFRYFPVKGFHNEVVIREACSRIHQDIAEVPIFVELALPGHHPEWGTYLCIPLTTRGEVIGLLGLFSHKPHIFDARDTTFHNVIGEQIGIAIHHARLYQSAQQLAITDELTGAFNRRYLRIFLEREISRSIRYQHGLSLIMLDLDGFKAYNDQFGHPAGDEALRELVRLLKRNLRAEDEVVRYGGDEFVMILPETDQDGAEIVAEKIRAAVASYPFSQNHLTVSLGVVYCEGAMEISPDSLIAMADQALYQAKTAGRNRIIFWEQHS